MFKATQPGLSQVFSPSTISALPGPCDLSPAALPAVQKDRAHSLNPFLTSLPFFEFRVYTLVALGLYNDLVQGLSLSKIPSPEPWGLKFLFLFLAIVSRGLFKIYIL